ncbi:MAG: glycosyltransferase family 9 protein [Gemmatimonadota bacterium]|jgi:ADP-heptose:LPS heptosyltransferase|nr:glycosyltransferase family 9 protein [Gemmatimonadota bacterium]
MMMTENRDIQIPRPGVIGPENLASGALSSGDPAPGVLPPPKRRPFQWIERGWKKIWFPVLVQFARMLPSYPMPDWRRDPVRILFLRPDRIGDAIVSTGIFREIVASNPRVRLDVLGTPRNQAVLRASPYLSTVHTLDHRRPWSWFGLMRQLRAARYDAVIDCMVTARSMATLPVLVSCGARHRIGIAGRGIDGALTVPVPPRPGAAHIIDHLSAFGRVFGIDPDQGDWRPELAVTDNDRMRAENVWRGASFTPGEEAGERSAAISGEGAGDPAGDCARVLVNLSAGSRVRVWPDERFVATIRHLKMRLPGAPVFVIGAPDERERVERVAELAGARAVSTPRFADMVALVSTATFLLTPDTSVAHVASATRTPAVVLYPAGKRSLWRLYGSPGISLEASERVLANYPLEPVLEAVDQLLGF